ncbi:MAG: hypothetical protein KUG58_10940 [Marinosulfonomonas sp.]|nr:hypothetical protein [Marinosulfonomonas sp.]
MAINQINLSLPALIATVALPAVAAYLYFYATQDPTLRPLGITKEELAVTDSAGNSSSINVQLNWGVDTTLKLSPNEVQEMLSRTLSAFNADFWFTINTVPGNSVKVSYQVGANLFGPYPIANTTEGIRIAIETQNIVQSSSKPPPP